jgi:hypothetical protein
MSEAIEKKMTIPEPFEVIMAFLKFLYSDRLDENEPWEVVCDLLVMANMYLLHRLKKLCCERLYRRHLSIDSCGLIFEKAIMAEEIGLKLLALSFMFQNYGSILKSNLLMDLPLSVREEFLDSVPEEAVLEVGRSRYTTPPQQPITSTNTVYSSSNMIYLNSNMSQPNTNNNYHNNHSMVNYTVASDIIMNQRATQTTVAATELIPINANNNNNSSDTMTVEV